MPGSFRLFEAAGISVYVHWSWLLVAYFELKARAGVYDSQVWNVAEYLALFAIVLLHEFGHALACRQVGGRAQEIVLWPLGGIAYVKPPARPGAVLWSIAAGPLVNVALVPLTVGLYFLAHYQGWVELDTDADHFLRTLASMNLLLLFFNLLPVYPLDGGQILQALLWFVLGRARSLFVVSAIGLVVGVGFVGWALWEGDVWLGVIAAFVAFRSWAGFQQARLLALLARAPRHPDAACPSCGAHPLAGEWWACEQCGRRLDTFAHRGVCPGCGQAFPVTQCPECLQAHPMADWLAAGATPGL